MKRSELNKRILALQEEIRMVRMHLLPELESARADFGNLINYFEAKFNEMERWFEEEEPPPQPKGKRKKSKRG